MQGVAAVPVVLSQHCVTRHLVCANASPMLSAKRVTSARLGKMVSSLGVNELERSYLYLGDGEDKVVTNITYVYHVPTEKVAAICCYGYMFLLLFVLTAICCYDYMLLRLDVVTARCCYGYMLWLYVLTAICSYSYMLLWLDVVTARCC